MCKCRLELEQRYSEQLLKTNPEMMNLKVRLEGYSFIIEGNHMTSKPVMPMVMEYDKVAKTGRVYRKKETTHIVANYCPFCGEPLKRRPNEQAG